ncbi:tetratricopeptide repeat protein [Peribacillus cavernae]|uniref:Tetratricopeptide repeat protein n=1 Tax=Peribacillus cavernae TaxID=1674310 RepID=A0A3S0VKS1_9BACI|nr:tetratricopeptide repeat protein [Peribacillus cavernae]MDQ0219402.1 tetratricopeptide (TPR) repeat protein [Peribacillus cavernae]RUQ27723.1 tetratricopeptide repeat protein [Peribacillus cavernae]
MNGKEKHSKKDNIILFPDLAGRLVDKGLDQLAKKDFREAAALFTQARELDPENPDLNVGLVVSLVELGLYPEAKDLCRELLNKGIGDYFQVVNIYLMVLLQLNEHEEMSSTIKALLEDDHIPPDKIEHFEKMLQFSQRVKEEKQHQEIIKEEKIHHEIETDGLFADKTESEILLTITRLAEVNIRPYVPEIRQFLLDEQANPFYKTVLINIMKEQEYDKEIDVSKFNETVTIIPAGLGDVLESEFIVEVTKIAEKRLGQENPTLLDMVKSLIERHNFIFYPNDPSENRFEEWAAAYQVLAEEYQGMKPDAEEIADLYRINAASIMHLVSHLKEIEEISYPTI